MLEWSGGVPQGRRPPTWPKNTRSNINSLTLRHPNIRNCNSPEGGVVG